MKNIFLLISFFLFGICSFSQDASGLRFAYNSWRSNKPLLDKYTAEYASKVAECKALKIANEKEIERLEAEKERVRKELLNGSFCDQCNRSKSEIEAADRIPFLEHIKNVRGTAIPAPASVIKKRMDEFDDKIRSLSYAVMTCEGDAFMLNGKIKTYTVYVESNIKTAAQNVMAINAYLSKELSDIILEKNNAVAALNKLITEVNSELPSIGNTGTELSNIESRFEAAKKQLEYTCAEKVKELNTGISTLQDQLGKEQQETEKTRLSNEIASLNNSKSQTERECQQSRQDLTYNYNKEKNEAAGRISSQAGALTAKISNGIRNEQNKLQSLANRSAQLLASYNTNIAFINKVIAEMKLDRSVAVSVSINSDRLLHRISISDLNGWVSNNIGSDLQNANNDIASCQSLIDNIENVRIKLIN